MVYLFGTLAIFSFIVQLLSVFVVFKKVDSTDNFRYRIFQFQFLFTWGFYFYSFSQQEQFSIFALSTSSAIIVCCLIIFFYCARLIRENKLSIVFSADSPEFHISKGPYSYVRHPFYSSYLFTYIALTISAQSWVCVVLCGLMFLNYYLAARFEENKFLNSNLRESYLHYTKATGMFLPRLRSKTH